jgi:hypothetical protein
MTIEELEKRLVNMEKRLGIVEDIEEIKKLQIHYVTLVSTAKWDEIMNCFAQNVEIDLKGGAFKSKDRIEIEKYFKEDLSKIHVGREGLFSVNPYITVDGDTAKGTWMLLMMFFHHSTWQPVVWLYGFYNMEYVRENGKWKISYLKWRSRMGLQNLVEHTKDILGHDLE